MTSRLRRLPACDTADYQSALRIQAALRSCGEGKQCQDLRVPKWLKMIIGILLLPACLGGAWALERVLRASGQADRFWVAAVAGAACWLSIYLLLPKPMWVYVFGHELTHALWTWLFGGRVKKFKATSSGGHVVVTRSNFLIALAPYFFPLYAMLVVAVYVVGARFWGWQPYAVWFHLLIGAAYAFHVTLTWHILKEDQTDISEQGYLFSAVITLLGNLIVLLIGVPLLTGKVDVMTAFRWWLDCSLALVHEVSHLTGGVK